MEKNLLARVAALMVAFAFLFALVCSAQAAPVGGLSADFNQDIRPILSRNCFKCHGPDDEARKAGLRLDRRELAIKAAESGSVPIVPGKPDDSEIIARINSGDASMQMPPPSANLALTAHQKDLLRQWITAGAEYKPHWAFVPPTSVPLPAVKKAAWPKNPIDAFVLAKLEAQGLAPSPQADRETLLRRVSLDLTGLQPTPVDVDAVLAEAGTTEAAWDRAYQHFVDRLMASPQYGERWARRWLDLARYSDTNGYEKDRVRTMWPYRDWVIRALNDDMPFNEFTIDQIAGDMLPNATQDQRLATGFHRNTMLNEEGGIDPQEYRFYSMVDRVGTTATTWLGLTMACAQCHTHKFDPITHREYYQFMALLNNADEPDMELPSHEITGERERRKNKIEDYKAHLPRMYPCPDADAHWQKAAAAEVKTASGAKAMKLHDDSWQIGSTTAATDIYTFAFDSDNVAVDRLRLETIRENGVGPGRTPHGNFVLSEIEVSVVPRGSKQEPTPIKITSADADFSQAGYPVGNAIDGKTDTGWAIDGPSGVQSRTATFVLDKSSLQKVAETAKKTGGKGGLRWTIRLVQDYGSQHTLGRFRLSLGSQTNSPDESRRREALARGFSQWLDTSRKYAAHWTVLRPVEAHSNGPLLSSQADDSVFVSGDVSKNDKYDLKYRTDLRGVTAIRLEVLPDDRLPGHGPGRIFYEGTPGDFLLTDLSLFRGGQKLPIAKALDSYHSESKTAAKAIDDDLQSPWDIDGGEGRRHVAVFVLQKPLAEAGEFNLKMFFEAYYACGLGRFRVSVTTDADPQASERPDDIEHMLTLEDSALTAADRARLQTQFLMEAPEMAAARRELEELIRNEPKYPTTLVMRERPPENPRPTFVHHRGEYLQIKDRVEPNVVAFLPPLPPSEPRNRLTLARWLVSRENPLTARVTVNRQWAAFFGLGLVRTVGDFGSQGELPSHPELLDWLAVRFMDDGWSMKKLDRLIVTSATYRQSSHVTPQMLEKDGENRLLARGPRVRLEAELIRDEVLHASGLLSSKMYGPSVFPPQPAAITTEGAYGPMTWTPSQGEDRYRRSLYTFSKRTAPFAAFLTFDAPSGEVCCARRDVSNTPLQALTLLNSDLFFEPAQAAGRQLAEDSRPIDVRLTDFFRRAMVRRPTPQEIASLTEFYDRQLARIKAGKLDDKALAGNGPGDVRARAAWTLTARAVFNLDEMVTKE
jgi:hypothetical protein